MSHGQFDELLYPEPHDDSRQERLEHLRQQLDDPEARQALAEYLAQRERQLQLADEPDKCWELAAAGQVPGTEDADDVQALSAALALNLGARQPRLSSLPVSIWVPALIGAVVGALVLWLGGNLVAELNARPQPTFTAAFSALLDQAQPSQADRELIDDLLAWHEKSYATMPDPARSRLVSQVSNLLDQYQPSSDEIRTVRKLVGVYHPPDEDVPPPSR